MPLLVWGLYNLNKCLKGFVIAAIGTFQINHWDQKHRLLAAIFTSSTHVYNTAHAQLDWGLVRRGVEEEEGQGIYLLDKQTES